MAFPIDTTPGLTSPMGSKMHPENAYGQNGYHGPSSDLPGDKQTSVNSAYGLAHDVVIPGAVTDNPNENANWQTRKVSSEQYPTAHGMKARNDKISFPTSNTHGPAARPVSKAAPAGSYKR